MVKFKYKVVHKKCKCKKNSQGTDAEGLMKGGDAPPKILFIGFLSPAADTSGW